MHSLNNIINSLYFYFQNLILFQEPIIGIFTYFAQIDEDGSGYLDIEEVKRTFVWLSHFMF